MATAVSSRVATMGVQTLRMRRRRNTQPNWYVQLFLKLSFQVGDVILLLIQEAGLKNGKIVRYLLRALARTIVSCILLLASILIPVVSFALQFVVHSSWNLLAAPEEAELFFYTIPALYPEPKRKKKKFHTVVVCCFENASRLHHLRKLLIS